MFLDGNFTAGKNRQKKGCPMAETRTIDKNVWGWALELDDADAERALKHMLWECQSELELRQRIIQAFNGPMILPLIWEEDKRSVSLLCDGKRGINAEIKPGNP